MRGHGAHLLPGTHQKYLYMWNRYHARPAGDWKKTIRKTHIIIKEGKKSNQVRICAPERGLKGKRTLHWQTPTLEGEQRKPQSWDPVLGRQAPLAGWRTAETNRRVIRCRNLTCEELIHWPASEAKERGRLHWLLCFP